ncbi:dnaJ homolog subfamily B member 9-like [Sphaeramia orbicularis]|uniref:dnaJ homolog subfamily B member 9-like n=1 Tax=Sphaeramia orbicularis TaxID=375764 RepID=UPI00117E07C1|nr:dnaJ homolog subfamily B member 9-like [Sphaeramia orbicularis]
MSDPSMALHAVLWIQAYTVLVLCLSPALPAASQTRRNYYDTLNVEPTATDNQIKKAFRSLAVKYHPDKNKSIDAEKNFRDITEAYKVLSNKDNRRLYDRLGHEAFLKNGSPIDPEEEPDTSFHFDFADIFHDFEGSPFVEESHFMWSFPQDEEDDSGAYEHYSFHGPGFTFYHSDGDEDEGDHC